MSAATNFFSNWRICQAI